MWSVGKMGKDYIDLYRVLGLYGPYIPLFRTKRQ